MVSRGKLSFLCTLFLKNEAQIDQDNYQGSYPFSETNFQDFSRTRIDFSRALKFTLIPTLPRSQCQFSLLPFINFIFLAESNKFPGLSRTSGLFPELSRTSGLFPELSRTSGLFPELSRTSGLFSELSRTSGLFPGLSRTSGLFPELSRTSGLFPELSRTSGLFPGFPSPGKCQNKIPGLSRFSRTCTNPEL